MSKGCSAGAAHAHVNSQLVFGRATGASSTRYPWQMQRHPDLKGLIQQGCDGSGKRQHVEADPPTSPMAAELVALRGAPRRNMLKAKSLKQQVATSGADGDAAEETAVQASQVLRSMRNILPAPQTAVSSEAAAGCGSVASCRQFVALLGRPCSV